jgi:hypothetical protein
MSRHLYFVCPMDHLEPVINMEFKGENYFYTSLGNSLVFDGDLMSNICTLIESKLITDIRFVLSDNNKVVADAFYKKDFVRIKWLKPFYETISIHKEESKVYDSHFINPFKPVLAKHLDNKVSVLKNHLSSTGFIHVNVDAMIFNTESMCFNDINLNLNYNSTSP